MEFQLPTGSIGFILVNYAIPVIAFAYALKLMLEKMRIFGYYSMANWVIAFLISISTVYFVQGLSLYITSASILAICMFKIYGGKKFFIGLIAAAVYFLLIAPFLAGL